MKKTVMDDLPTMFSVDTGCYGSQGDCLQNLLQDRAIRGHGKLILYPLGNTTIPREHSYRELFLQAKQNSSILLLLPDFKLNHPTLIHLSDHWDNILWFWAVLFAGGLPVLSPSFSNIDSHRQKHLEGLSTLLQSPICLTRDTLLPMFDGGHTMKLHTVEAILGSRPPKPNLAYDGTDMQQIPPKPSDTAALMLTSGTTGSAKAVCLTHDQIFTAIQGKASVRSLPPGGPFLNWIGLDHVASLVEIHLQALWLGYDQVHVHAADVISRPRVFIDLLSKHQVARSFAPNFFLARLVSSVEQAAKEEKDVWDLSNLSMLASGGEANDVRTCIAASTLLERYGAARHVITPGFGMTETCAGSIFNLECPDHDIRNGLSMASVGKCMPGIDMRIASSGAKTGITTQEAAYNEPGYLELRGAVVFPGYYRNPSANLEAFSSGNGWFRTGDLACIDSGGNLRLLGRSHDFININSVKIVIDDLQAHLEQQTSGSVSRILVFPTRAAHTEQVTVVWVPTEWPVKDETRVAINNIVMQTCIETTSSRPIVFSLQKRSLSMLPTSALGKVSRAKMRALVEAGTFDDDQAAYEQAIMTITQRNQKAVALENYTPEETWLIADFAATLGRAIETIGPTTSVFELGFTSMDLIHLKHRIDTRLRISVPIITFMKHPNARSLAIPVKNLLAASSHEESREFPPLSVDYDPVVTLRSGGTKTPLWLVHPGVGEVLVFINLAWHLADDERPIYALRARGFELGQTQFSSIAETVDTYVSALLDRQPSGPYAIAGYSYGAMLAFEIAKKLDSLDTAPGRGVKFLGSFNLPPHIKSRMRQLSWNICLLNLSQFLGLLTEDYAEKKEEAYRAQSRSTALATIMDAADPGRLEELGLGGAELARWATVAFGLQSMAVDYEPLGAVGAIDIFHAMPLKIAASSRQEWIEVHLSRWKEHCQSEPRFHEVGGAHYTMIAPDHVLNFSDKLKRALQARGL